MVMHKGRFSCFLMRHRLLTLVRLLKPLLQRPLGALKHEIHDPPLLHVQRDARTLPLRPWTGDRFKALRNPPS